MKTKIEIKSVFGKLLFEYEKENNSLKDTVIEAVRCGADLYGADLYGADLSGADLSRADLRGADLRGADLRGADLSRADLSGADLRGADLRGADLRGADLYGWGKIKDVRDVMIVGPIGSRHDYTTFYHTDKGIFVACGCFRGNIAEFESKVNETHENNQHGEDYRNLIDFVKKYYTEKFE